MIVVTVTVVSGAVELAATDDSDVFGLTDLTVVLEVCLLCLE